MPRTPEPSYHKARRRWYAVIGEPNASGRRRAVYAPPEVQTKADAWQWFQAEAARRAPRPAAGTETVEWVFELYLEWAESRVAAGRMDGGHYAARRSHLSLFADRFGSRPVSALSPKLMTEYLDALRKDYSRDYVRDVAASVRASLNWGVREAKIGVNPILGYETPRAGRSPSRFAERREAAAFVAFWRTRRDRTTTRGRFDRISLLLVRCLIRTGARPKELCRLRWEHIHWRGWKTPGGQWAATAVLTEWKAAESTGKPRTIYFTPALTRALKRLKAQRVNPEWVFVHGRGRGGKGAGEPWKDGSRFSKAVLAVRRELIAHQAELRGREDLTPWEARLAAAEVRDSGPNRLSNYRWRHTAASTLLMLGVDMATTAELLGTSPQMLHQHYGHLLSEHLGKAAGVLSMTKLKR